MSFALPRDMQSPNRASLGTLEALVALMTLTRPCAHAANMLRVFQLTLASSHDEGWSSSFVMIPHTLSHGWLNEKP